MNEFDAGRRTTPSTSTPRRAAKIELNRPEALNAWNEQFGRDLLAAVERRSPRTTRSAR